MATGISPPTPNSNLSFSANDPLAGEVLEATSALETLGEQDQISELQNQMMIETLNHNASMKMAMMEALHAIAMQAISFSQQFIGDEIAQVKKGLENSGKAV
jgi:hypothetical protein